MSFYQKLAEVGSKYGAKHLLFKYGFNLSPMYRRSTARVTTVSKDLLKVAVKLPISYKNRNYVNSIYGGSMFAAVDPFPMVQLMNLLGDDYVVWDKSAEIFFKRPAREHLYAYFTYTLEELENIKTRIVQQKELDIVKSTLLTNKDQSIIYCEVRKTMYVADKSHYRQKRALRKDKPIENTV
ncbi:DUF4442 domain-containing protein [Flagellimonas allohymeniacidonis]|uniref:DUF4442 domain-containing protein n=1 Tax=Flagellimonas allohymeniacidonis TaxID=2517819 RepID=A0A4Q8QCQ4_9FLAO|nr:DUF4442 domain-containing protein [Allomuricauda hymeniacidonis]TAI46888.1 DUF4442 domain-containing protein [Allomuricauda hymeniacidonis]